MPSACIVRRALFLIVLLALFLIVLIVSHRSQSFSIVLTFPLVFCTADTAKSSIQQARVQIDVEIERVQQERGVVATKQQELLQEQSQFAEHKQAFATMKQATEGRSASFQSSPGCVSGCPPPLCH